MYINNIIVFNNSKENYLIYFEKILKLFKDINFNIIINKFFINYFFIYLLNY